MTDGACRKLIPRPIGLCVQARRGLEQVKPLGQLRKVMMSGRKAAKWMMLGCQEKLLGIKPVTVPKPTQVGWY